MRLIDADTFKQDILYCKKVNNNECLTISKEVDVGMNQAFDLILQRLDKQRTAYDVENVIELLESLKHPYITFREGFGKLYMIDYYIEKAERFVRSCGVDSGLLLSYQDRIETLHRYKENCEKAGGKDE